MCRKLLLLMPETCPLFLKKLIARLNVVEEETGYGSSDGDLNTELMPWSVTGLHCMSSHPLES